MLGNIDINLKPSTGLLDTAAFLDVRQYINERDIVDLRTYGYLINETFLLTDYEETTINSKAATSSASSGSSFDLNNSNFSSNFIIFNTSGLIKNGSSSGNGTIVISGNGGAHGIDGGVLPLPEDVVVLLKMITMSVVLGLMILITIIGNVFVIAAIILERNLQNVANYLVVSLAVADLFVACLVMPLGAVYEISEGWILGPELCDIWTSCDVLCCTASILHLVAIATDRYWTVTNIDYHNLRTPRRIFCMIFTVWFFAVIVSLAPLFGWKDPEYMERIEQQKCMVSQDVVYQIFATCCSFYVPLLMILVLYWKIYKIARKRIQRRTQRLRYNENAKRDAENESVINPIDKMRVLFAKLMEPFVKFRVHIFIHRRCRRKCNRGLEFIEPTPFSATRSLQMLRKDLGLHSYKIQLVEDLEQVDDQLTFFIYHVVAHYLKEKWFQHDVVICHAAREIITLLSQTLVTELSQKMVIRVQYIGIQSKHKKRRIKICFSKDISSDKGFSSSACDNFTNGSNANIREETEFSTSNIEDKSHAGTEFTNVSDEATTMNAEERIPLPLEISTVSQQVAATTSTFQQHVTAIVLTSANPRLGASSNNKQQLHATNPHQKLAKRRQQIEAKRERKAAQTLAIITGAFVVCWLPFFVMALTLSLCKSCEINAAVASLFLWLGYFNSTLNPIIYTIFNPEFRRAFQRLLFGKKYIANKCKRRAGNI